MLSDHGFVAEELQARIKANITSAREEASQQEETADANQEQPPEQQPLDETDETETIDPFAFAKTLSDEIELLPPGTLGRKYPYKCLVCRTRRQPSGKVGDLTCAKPHAVKYFLQRHIESTQHQLNLHKQRQASQGDDAPDVPCQGFLGLQFGGAVALAGS